MTTAEILSELRAAGGAAYRHGERVRVVPPSAASPNLVARIRERRAELLAVLPDAPPEIAALRSAAPLPAERPLDPSRSPDCDAGTTARAWVIPSDARSDMRLVVVNPPPWPPGVYEAAALVEVLDVRQRADRKDAQEIANRLDAVLSALRTEGIEAWLAC
jgi:hypothetical protein